MDFVKQHNKKTCKCEKCGSMFEYKSDDPTIVTSGNTINPYTLVCPVCGSTIHKPLHIGSLDRR